MHYAFQCQDGLFASCQVEFIVSLFIDLSEKIIKNLRAQKISWKQMEVRYLIQKFGLGRKSPIVLVTRNNYFI